MFCSEIRAQITLDDSDVECVNSMATKKRKKSKTIDLDAPIPSVDLDATVTVDVDPVSIDAEQSDVEQVSVVPSRIAGQI